MSIFQSNGLQKGESYRLRKWWKESKLWLRRNIGLNIELTKKIALLEFWDYQYSDVKIETTAFPTERSSNSAKLLTGTLVKKIFCVVTEINEFECRIETITVLAKEIETFQFEETSTHGNLPRNYYI